ncbi:MAG: DoxX family protein [Flavobacteriaceae bacterium]
MESTNQIPRGRLWTSFILQGLVILMFLLGSVNNILQTEMAVNAAVDMGYPEASVLYLGIVLLLSTILYALPKTNFIGAVLLTAWLGGAVATHVIHNDPLTLTLFPVVFGILVWLSLWLRDPKLQKVVSSNKA